MSKHTAPGADTLRHADYEALAHLRYALRRFLAFSAEAAHKAGLPPQQHQALLAIKGAPKGQTVTVGQLAEQLFIAPHTATELVGRLVEAGLAARTTDASDRRRQTLELTDKAEALLVQLSHMHLQEIREMTPELIATLQRLSADTPSNSA